MLPCRPHRVLIGLVTIVLLTATTLAQNGRIAPAGEDPSAMAGGGTIYPYAAPPGWTFNLHFLAWLETPGIATGNWDTDDTDGVVLFVETPMGSTSTSCEDPYQVTLRVQAPMEPGEYIFTLFDATFEWDPIMISIVVDDVPFQVLNTLIDTVVVGDVGTRQFNANGTIAVTDIGCAAPFYPLPESTFEYTVHPPMDHVDMPVQTFVVSNTENIPALVYLQSSVAGEFTTYVYRTTSWFTIGAFELRTVFVITTGEEEHAGAQDTMTLFPNPTNGLVTLTASTQGASTVSVLDLMGRQVLTRRVPLNADGVQQSISLEGLAAGTYLVSLTDDHGPRAPMRLIVQ